MLLSNEILKESKSAELFGEKNEVGLGFVDFGGANTSYFSHGSKLD